MSTSTPDSSKLPVFLSWSGEVSKGVAEALRDWLPNVLQGVEPFMSADDISKGAMWSTEIHDALSDAGFGILCLTSDNHSAPWLNYEAGALVNRFERTRVTPFLLGIAPSQVPAGPLAGLQMTSATAADVRAMVASVNEALPDPLTAERLTMAVDTWWPRLEAALDQLPASSSTPARSVDSMVEELLDLVRGQQATLANAALVVPGGHPVPLDARRGTAGAIIVSALEAMGTLSSLIESAESLNPDERKELRDGMNTVKISFMALVDVAERP